MRTVSDIQKALVTFVERHQQLKAFYTNSIEEMDINKMDVVLFPFMYAQCEGAEIDVGYTDFTYRIIIADIVVENQLPHLDDVFTETLLIMQDVFASLYNTDASNIPEEYGMDMPVQCSPFSSSYDNLLTGWDATIFIRVPNALELCNAPV